MNPETRDKIRTYLQQLVDLNIKRAESKQLDDIGTVSDYLQRTDKDGNLQPFYAAMIPLDVRRKSTFQRGLVTGIGVSFEECARFIALDYHADAQRNYDLSGELSLNALNEIDNQVARFEHAAQGEEVKPTLDEMIAAVLAAQDDGATETRTNRADLFVRAHDGTEYYFELKSPYPNKGQCLEVTQRLLRIHLLLNTPRPDVQAYFSFAYNPYGATRADYNWSITPAYTPFEQAVLIGQEFWALIGDANTYADLLAIYHEVGQANADRITQTLSA